MLWIFTDLQFDFLIFNFLFWSDHSVNCVEELEVQLQLQSWDAQLLVESRQRQTLHRKQILKKRQFFYKSATIISCFSFVRFHNTAFSTTFENFRIFSNLSDRDGKLGLFKYFNHLRVVWKSSIVLVAFGVSAHLFIYETVVFQESANLKVETHQLCPVSDNLFGKFAKLTKKSLRLI